MVMGGELEYHGVVDCLEYFVSALPHSVDKSYRKHTLINELISLAEIVAEGNVASPLAIDYAQRIVSCKQKILDGWGSNSHLDQGEPESVG